MEVLLVLVLVILACNLPISELALILIPELTLLRIVIEVRVLHVLVQREHIHDQRNQWALLQVILCLAGDRLLIDLFAIDHLKHGIIFALLVRVLFE